MHAEIKLGKSDLLSKIDLIDFESVSQYSWCARPRSDRKGFYAFRYIRVGPRKYDKQLLHHFIKQPPPGMEVDHKDGDGLNNTRGNLRVATHKQNACNSKKCTDGEVPYKGVTKANLIHGKYAPTKAWRARIRHDGKLVDLGHYLTAEEAALAYNKAALRYFGEYALLNEVPK